MDQNLKETIESAAIFTCTSRAKKKVCKKKPTYSYEYLQRPKVHYSGSPGTNKLRHLFQQKVYIVYICVYSVYTAECIY